ncbi:hypothetical protein BX600DRAFT_505973 [Xylariales sp. PMI_506]|nr:hypothetical protein BX600DRAFT_505973 [Xylariales sp. PMI_506]
MEPPAKRARFGYSPYDDDEDEDPSHDELSLSATQLAARQDPLYQLDKKRAKSAFKLKSRFEEIFEKYSQDFDGVGDEIDLRTGEVIVDNGHLESLQDDGDGSEGSVDEVEESRILHGPRHSSALSLVQRRARGAPPTPRPGWKDASGLLASIPSAPHSRALDSGPPMLGLHATDPAWQVPAFELPLQDRLGLVNRGPQHPVANYAPYGSLFPHGYEPQLGLLSTFGSQPYERVTRVLEMAPKMLTAPTDSNDDEGSEGEEGESEDEDDILTGRTSNTAVVRPHSQLQQKLAKLLAPPEQPAPREASRLHPGGGPRHPPRQPITTTLVETDDSARPATDSFAIDYPTDLARRKQAEFDFPIQDQTATTDRSPGVRAGYSAGSRKQLRVYGEEYNNGTIRDPEAQASSYSAREIADSEAPSSSLSTRTIADSQAPSSSLPNNLVPSSSYGFSDENDCQEARKADVSTVIANPEVLQFVNPESALRKTDDVRSLANRIRQKQRSELTSIKDKSVGLSRNVQTERQSLNHRGDKIAGVSAFVENSIPENPGWEVPSATKGLNPQPPSPSRTSATILGPKVLHGNPSPEVSRRSSRYAFTERVNSVTPERPQNQPQSAKRVSSSAISTLEVYPHSKPQLDQLGSRQQTPRKRPGSSTGTRSLVTPAKLALASLIPDNSDDEDGTKSLSPSVRSADSRLRSSVQSSSKSQSGGQEGSATPSPRHRLHSESPTQANADAKLQRGRFSASKSRARSSPLVRDVLLRTPRKGVGAERTPKPQSPTEALVRTPGGTLRRCGEDGFACEREFCFTCCT